MMNAKGCTRILPQRRGASVAKALLLGLALVLGGQAISQTPPTAQVLRPELDRWITSGDHSGERIAMTADTALIAVPGDDIRSANEGSVYVMRLTSSGWRTEARLLSPLPATGLLENVSLAMEDDLAVVGQPSSNSGVGRVHLYRRSAAGEWAHEAELSGSIAGNSQAVRGFGISVAVHNGTVLVGASTPVLPPGSFVFSPAFAFRRVGTQWQADGQLASSVSANAAFGAAAVQVALGTKPGSSRLLAAVRRPASSVGGTSMSVVQIYEGVPSSGQTTWSLLQFLTAPVATRANALTLFGERLQIDGSWLLVGNSHECPTGSTVCGYVHAWRLFSAAPIAQFSQSLANPGSGDEFAADFAVQASFGRLIVGYGGASNRVQAYALGSGSQWVATQQVVAAGVNGADGFGRSLAAAGQHLLVGAPDFSATPRVGTGRVLSYERVITDWANMQALDLTEPPAAARFGAQVGIQDNAAVTQSLLVAEPLDTYQDGVLRGGSVHVYACAQRPCSLIPAARLQSPTPAENAQFGRALAVDPVLNLVAVGERRGNGRVQLFRRVSNTQWQHLATLVAPIELASWDFGTSVVMRDGWIAAGARLISGTQIDDGRVVVARFNESGVRTVAPQVLSPSPVDGSRSRYGAALAFAPRALTSTGPSLYVGAPGAPVFDGLQLLPIGAVDRYELSASPLSWFLADRLQRPQLPTGQGFGSSLAAVADQLLIGAPSVDPPRVFRYSREPDFGDPTLARVELAPAAAGNGSAFGSSVAIAEFDRYLIGAPQMDALGGGCFQSPMTSNLMLDWCADVPVGARLGESLAASRAFFAAGGPSADFDTQARLGGGMVLVSAAFSPTQLLAPQIQPASPLVLQPASASVEYQSTPTLDSNRRLDIALDDEVCSVSWNVSNPNGLRFGCSLIPVIGGPNRVLSFYVRATANHQSGYVQLPVDVIQVDALFEDGFDGP